MPETDDIDTADGFELDLPLELFLSRKVLEEIAQNIFDQNELIAMIYEWMRDRQTFPHPPKPSAAVESVLGIGRFRHDQPPL